MHFFIKQWSLCLYDYISWVQSQHLTIYQRELNCICAIHRLQISRMSPSIQKYLPLWLQLQNWAHFQLSYEKKHGCKNKWNLAEAPLQKNSSISYIVLYYALPCQTFAGEEIKNSLLTERFGILFQSILIVLSTISSHSCYVNKNNR